MMNRRMDRALKAHQRRKVEYAELKARGICTSCKKRKSSGKIVWCEVCREQKRGRRIARYHARRKAGLCVECGSASGDKSRCESCSAEKHDYRIARYYGRKASGLCVECGDKSDGLTRCERCRLAEKVRVYLCAD